MVRLRHLSLQWRISKELFLMLVALKGGFKGTNMEEGKYGRLRKRSTPYSSAKLR
jgi:hypothetical protein